MSLISPNLTKIDPKTGAELAQSIGADLNEGVQIALFPDELSDAELGPEFTYAPGVTARAVIAKVGEWGTRVLDLVLDGSGKGVKWWKVRGYAKEEKMDLVPVTWQGPISEIPERLFSAKMGVRFFNSGPWFWPIAGSHLEDNLTLLEQFCKDDNDAGQVALRSVLGGNPDSSPQVPVGGDERGEGKVHG